MEYVRRAYFTSKEENDDKKCASSIEKAWKTLIKSNETWPSDSDNNNAFQLPEPSNCLSEEPATMNKGSSTLFVEKTAFLL